MSIGKVVEYESRFVKCKIKNLYLLQTITQFSTNNTCTFSEDHMTSAKGLS